ncbi:E3 ubiquitin-protein ligase Mdm2-like isoform X2 [Nymphalis io]|uniref:E3 ubiquitin-protein ligase Mdm2-like isoform X2 n=1 Tax=Inachis io TaxID=171585 RepID=UPI00216A2096|nr:E3 ubiquitin-protein ligase Mdm2-like isoform X2 [Nymphalis io]
MTTTASYSPEPTLSRRCSTETIFNAKARIIDPSWSRRCSTETIFSIQGRETDFVRDTSDTEWGSDEQGVEFEPVTDTDEPLAGDTSELSENEIITTKVVEVVVGDDGELQLADTECTDSSSDSELDLHDYWSCAHCRAPNNNPLYRYCQKCFNVRKNLFPPRPRPKHKRKASAEPADALRPLSQDSGVDSLAGSQVSAGLKRRAGSEDRLAKRSRRDSDSDAERSDGAGPVAPARRSASEPAPDACVVCVSQPKTGVFAHGRIAHICCCYTCAVKIWKRAGRCPVCNCKVSNVLRAVVM